MKKNSKKETVSKNEESKLQTTNAELLDISQKREQELQELDRIAKMLVRRDLELSGIREKREAELKELEKKTEELENSRRGLMNILEDVEEALKIAEEEKDKTLSIITNFTDGLLIFDPGNKVSLINPRAEEFFHIKAVQIIGKHILEFVEIPRLEPLTNILGKEIKGIFRKELALEENLILEISSIPIIREEEKLGSLVILHDITREKTIERIKTEFVSISAHQLRTPLSAVKWTLRMLLDGDLGKITLEQKEILGKTYKSNERMINLINDLLNVTRIEEGRYLYKPTIHQIEEITQSVINSYQEKIKRKKIKFEFKKSKEKLPKIKVDLEKIRLAIENLIDNALRYTLTGGKIRVSLKSNKEEITFEIKDTGLGIPKRQHNRVFSKFFRAANVIRTETEGTGLGLFITKNIIEAHGGKIWFKSEEGKGATFYFALPLRKGP